MSRVKLHRQNSVLVGQYLHQDPLTDTYVRVTHCDHLCMSPHSAGDGMHDDMVKVVTLTNTLCPPNIQFYGMSMVIVRTMP